MFTKELWDHVSPINGVSAERIYESQPELRDQEDVWLIKAGNNVLRIEDASVLKANMALFTLTDEQVMEIALKETAANSYAQSIREGYQTINDVPEHFRAATEKVLAE